VKGYRAPCAIPFLFRHVLRLTVAFDADNAGIWPLHCHLLYHLDSGMFTVVKYDGADTKFWQPNAKAKEFTPSN